MRDFLERHAVATCFVLAFAISWTALLAVVGGPRGLPVASEDIAGAGVAVLLGPAGAAILVLYLTRGRPGVRDLLGQLRHWRVAPRWYGLALLLGPGSTAASLAVLSRTSDHFTPAIATADDPLALCLSGLAAGLVVGLLEELGWTGFVLPRLRQARGLVTTGLVIGVAWGAWHFLLFWSDDSFSTPLSVALLLAQLFSWLPAYRLLMVWVHDQTMSLPAVVVMHASLVAGTVILEPVLSGAPLLAYILLRASLLWVVVAIVLWARTRTPARFEPLQSER